MSWEEAPPRCRAQEWGVGIVVTRVCPLSFERAVPVLSIINDVKTNRSGGRGGVGMNPGGVALEN
jgi:hypothetical protein